MVDVVVGLIVVAVVVVVDVVFGLNVVFVVFVAVAVVVVVVVVDVVIVINVFVIVLFLLPFLSDKNLNFATKFFSTFWAFSFPGIKVLLLSIVLLPLIH